MVEKLQTLQKSQVVLYGVETHVCVLQTAFDLLDKGYDVWVLTDWVSSSRELERTTALTRLLDVGVQYSTLESCLFEMIQNSKDEHFKTVLNEVVKDLPEDPFTTL